MRVHGHVSVCLCVTSGKVGGGFRRRVAQALVTSYAEANGIDLDTLRAMAGEAPQAPSENEVQLASKPKRRRLSQTTGSAGRAGKGDPDGNPGNRPGGGRSRQRGKGKNVKGTGDVGGLSGRGGPGGPGLEVSPRNAEGAGRLPPTPKLGTSLVSDGVELDGDDCDDDLRGGSDVVVVVIPPAVC